jgi:hypothetical protein
MTNRKLIELYGGLLIALIVLLLVCFTVMNKFQIHSCKNNEILGSLYYEHTNRCSKGCTYVTYFYRLVDCKNGSHYTEDMGHKYGRLPQYLFKHPIGTWQTLFPVYKPSTIGRDFP